jgi:hypothetical protein
MRRRRTTRKRRGVAERTRWLAEKPQQRRGRRRTFLVAPACLLPCHEVLLGDLGEQFQERRGSARAVHAGERGGGDGAHRGRASEVADRNVWAQVGDREFGNDGNAGASSNEPLDDVELVAAKRDAGFVCRWFGARFEVDPALSCGGAGEHDTVFAGEVMEA